LSKLPTNLFFSKTIQDLPSKRNVEKAIHEHINSDKSLKCQAQDSLGSEKL
jgi:hypothetical protein